MSVILPWNRKNTVAQPSPRSRAGGTGIRKIAAAVAIAALILIASRLHVPPEEVVWDLPGGRLLCCREELYLVEIGGETFIMDSRGSSKPVRPPETDERVTLRPDGASMLRVRSKERVVSVLGDGAVLTERQSNDGQYGEPWALSLYGPSGSLSWTSLLPGAVAQASATGGRLAVGICDLTAGAAPSIALLDLGAGHLTWSRALPPGAWRALALRADGAAIAVLTSGVAAFDNNGSLAWSFDAPRGILAAAVVGDAICLCTRVNRLPLALVHRYEITALSSEGTPMWSAPLAQEPVKLQQWMGEEAVVAIAENHVLGLKMRDGARLFAERTRANPVELCGDKLLIRDSRGVRLVRLRSVRLPSG